ncbi:MAG: Dps family protein [Bacteroidales bacterium]|jgi:starvation-inducible DNA-binding protein|nr:Dps family protein [Bacteroidales bacterium]
MKREIKNKSEIVKKLNLLLSDYEIYYQNLRALHWNIKGKMFFMLHEKYEEYYNQSAEIIDEIAERILMLGATPFHTYEDFLKNATIKPVKDIKDANKSVHIVLENNEVLLNKTYEALAVADESGDEGTLALLSDIIGGLEKTIWMLNSSIE